jgi:hypothetical protein
MPASGLAAIDGTLNNATFDTTGAYRAAPFSAAGCLVVGVFLDAYNSAVFPLVLVGLVVDPGGAAL